MSHPSDPAPDPSTPAPRAADPGSGRPQGVVSRRAGRPPRRWEALAVVVVKPISRLFVRRKWRGGENIPRTGGLIIAANHLSWSDPVLLAHYLYNNGRWPTILAKAGLFRLPLLGRAVRQLQAIPVERNSTEATRSLKIAEERLRNGACIMFYPEGTISRDPEMWPMAGKTGVARLALTSGVPVIPIAHWGAQELLPYGEKKPRLLPRTTFHVLAGPPVDLSRYAGQPLRGSVLRDATADIMAAITALLAEIRDEKAPEVPYDPKNDSNG
ncbi:lysophospholipid acyltransferase family protein [Microbispora sp. H10670]|uniref:lysophospholipid acyltransferase family protein n=2 Tax=Microbispora TaxID=2005 RepID=UPI002873079B|nr:lysophospholipid acyltransferase family protein [Microbispora sp. H10670]